MTRYSETVDAIWPRERPAPTRNVACRHCGRKNRVEVPAAVAAPHRFECGACGRRLFLGDDDPLTRLSPTAFAHGLDRKALAALQSVPGIPRLVQWSQETIGERSARIMLMSDAILCGEDQFPELLALMDLARARLDMTVRPSLFLGESPHMNALATGVKEPVIVLRSALLDQLGDDELVAVLGHELGHLLAGHPLYQQVARVVLVGGAAMSGAVRLLSLPIQRALLRWSRCAELTADRAALLATRDLETCMAVMLKFAGGNRPGTKVRTRIGLAPFVRQVRDLAKTRSESWLDGALSGWLAMDRSHPFIAWRVMHLVQWVEHGSYLDVLAGDYVRVRRREPRPTQEVRGETMD